MKEIKPYIVSDRLMFKISLLGFDFILSYFIRDIWQPTTNSIFISFLQSFINLNLVILLIIGLGSSIAIGFTFLNQRINEYWDEKEKNDLIKGERNNMSPLESLEFDLQISEYQLNLAFEKEEYLEIPRIKRDIVDIERKISNLKKVYN